MQQIVDGLTREKDGRKIPVILFTKGAGPMLADMVETGCDALGVDWTTSLAEARKYTEDKVALQGNLDPATLREDAETIRKGVADQSGDDWRLWYGSSIPPQFSKMAKSALDGKGSLY